MKFNRLIASCVVASLPVLALAADMDGNIEKSIKNSYENSVLGHDVKVDVKDGVATLKGKVPDASWKELAEETAKKTPGVTSVNNKILVEDVKDQAHSDKWIAAKVKSSLAIHSNVSAMHTRVDVRDGVVTLTGVADSQASKDLATQYARDIEGVREVNNDLAIKSVPDKGDMTRATDKPDYSSDRTTGQKFDDITITSKVKMALAGNRSTSAMHTNVTTKNGIVMIEGEAANDAEKSLVTKLASDVKGVVNVENNMTVRQ